ncbi:hypothetical protein GCM10023264_03900 [Sphingomonas daechungensis]|uniref:hypothetical protein n=1 Tax=Sphingomonas daechungensis TaxID=1176646 RepID=UPI0031EFBA87
MRKPRILLFGDSHSYAVQRAIEKREGKGKPAPLKAHRLSKIKNGKMQGDTSLEEFIEIVRPLRQHDIVISMIGGNQHAVFSTIQHANPFDFLEPGKEAKLQDGAELIPYRMLETAFEKGIRNGDGKSIEALRKATSARMIHVLPPPPKSDNEFIQQFHESFFAKEGIANQGVSSPALRLKFWTLQTRVLEMLCDDLGVELMMPPAKAVDRRGFLARDFYANDATHANHFYGELLLREIETRFTEDKTRGEA